MSPRVLLDDNRKLADRDAQVTWCDLINIHRQIRSPAPDLSEVRRARLINVHARRSRQSNDHWPPT